MFLKSLEIQGFKSFPDKTVLQFGSDITAIVGPNGSGKSNISDAISWVMGEQSSKALRGAKMEDVIFGGTQKRSAVGFAEATLVLDNQDGSLKLETPEVMITRRYYRSGESEYYINKQSARLRDIHELLMDTGLGREGYSNIGQGRIDEILAVKSTDRREIFEEAAGISKCRYRREETERRLAATEDNLLRIGDKISELEMQVEPLRQQAEKAQKYLVLRDELKGYEIAVWLDSLAKIEANAKKAEQDYASAAFILEQAHNELSSLYAASEQLSLELNRESLVLEEKRDAIAAAEQERQQVQAGQAVVQTSIDNTAENIARVRQELADQENRSGGIAGQIAEQQARIAQIGGELAQIDEKLRAAAEKSKALTDASGEAAEKLAALRANHALLTTEAAGRRAEIVSMKTALSDILERKQTLSADREAALARQKTVADQAAACEKSLAAAQENVTAAQNMIAGYALRLKARADKRDALKKQLSDAEIGLDTAGSKLRMLREMERDYEGFSKAVKLVMQEAARGALRGVHGPVSALIHTDDAFTTAIETALGAAMQNIVVDSDNDGKAAIQLLKRRDAGRATFLPLGSISGRRMPDGEFRSQHGFVGVASALVTFDGKYESIVENLLGRTVVAESLDDAVRMARASGSRARIVTLDGQVMNPGGSMTGGSASRSAGVLSRANEIERLEKQRAELEKQKKALQQAYQEAAESAAKTEFELTAVQGQLREAEDETLRRTEEQKQVQLLQQALRDNLESYEAELSRVESRSGADEVRMQTLEALAADAAGRAEALETQIAGMEQGQSAVSEQTAKLADEITALRLDEASKNAERESAQQSVRQLESLCEAMQGDREQKLALIAGYEAQVGALEAKLEDSRRQAERMAQEIGQKRELLREAVEHRASIEAKRNQTEKQAQEKNQSILLMERESARLEQKKATSELEEKQLLDKLWDAYELTPTTAQAEAAEVESIAAANKRITELRRKISALGTPNLGAIDEFARVNERYEYLAGQRDDVLHARGELESIVSSITNEMTDIFVREFGRINEYFGQTFTEMFGGGKASLVLEDPSQPLECGIEIRVQPPGKQLKTITLLSGGEKAFVAIALYFAILKVRPTPFCMLDEIDAALDDRNVERFALYLRNLCKKTQFIVITHRRGTMEASDVLYGVTMQEQGVSKILHIRLGEMEQQLGITG